MITTLFYILAYAIVIMGVVVLGINWKREADRCDAQAELIRSLQEALKEAEARIEGLLRERK